jgi:hypothetical protein
MSVAVPRFKSRQTHSYVLFMAFPTHHEHCRHRRNEKVTCKNCIIKI